jgi:hypothetical protein
MKFFLHFVFKINSFRNRVKRGDSNTESKFNLYINTLIVIDRTIYVWFKETYSTMTDSFFLSSVKGKTFNLFTFGNS